jgi:hypothetical protein
VSWWLTRTHRLPNRSLRDRKPSNSELCARFFFFPDFAQLRQGNGRYTFKEIGLTRSLLMDNDVMTTTEPNSLIPPQIMAELQAAADRAAKGFRDPEIMAKACERMDQLRE